MAVTQGAVWVANGLDATVSRIDSQTNQVSQVIAVGNGPTGATAGEGAVWVTNSTDGTVTRIDPASGRVTRTFPAVLVRRVSRPALDASGSCLRPLRRWSPSIPLPAVS